MTRDNTPRIRWAGIVFGALFALVAAAGLVVTLDAELRTLVQEWAVPVGLSIDPTAGMFALVVGIGAAMLAVATIALVHEIERDAAARREDPLAITRLACDIFGAFPVEPVVVTCRVVRPGRTIELVEAALTQGERIVLVARAWLQRRGDTARVAGTHDVPIRGPETMPLAEQGDWSGGFVKSIEVRRGNWQPGRGAFWAYSALGLVADEPVSDLAHAARLFDLANGMVPRAKPNEVLFPNLDLTLHVFRHPRRGWVGFDTSVSFGPSGHGLTSAVLHDADGAFGRLSQTLTVRPRGG